MMYCIVQGEQKRNNPFFVMFVCHWWLWCLYQLISFHTCSPQLSSIFIFFFFVIFSFSYRESNKENGVMSQINGCSPFAAGIFSNEKCVVIEHVNTVSSISSMSKTALDRRSLGIDVLRDFRSIQTMFRTINDTINQSKDELHSNKKMEEHIVDLFEQYMNSSQRRSKTGVLSSAHSKKQVVQQLRGGLTHMKARTMIRAQSSLHVERTRAMAMTRNQVDAIKRATAAAAALDSLHGSLRRGPSSKLGRRPHSLLPPFAEILLNGEERKSSEERSEEKEKNSSNDSANALSSMTTADGSSSSSSSSSSSTVVPVGLGENAEDVDDVIVGHHDCHKCGLRMEGDKLVYAAGKYWCVENCTCFQCIVCERLPPGLAYFVGPDENIYCADDYLDSIHGSHLCGTCFQPIELDDDEEGVDRGDGGDRGDRGDGGRDKVDAGMGATSARGAGGPSNGVSLMGRVYHRGCLQCTGCSRHLLDDVDLLLEGSDVVHSVRKKPYCSKCFQHEYRTCPRCELDPGPDAVFYCNRNWHPECFSCHECGSIFDKGEFYSKDSLDGRGELPYCESHFQTKFAVKCTSCRQPIVSGSDEKTSSSFVNANSMPFHVDCFQCTVCQIQLDRDFYSEGGHFYCEDDYFQTFGETCFGCEETIRDTVLEANDHQWHLRCFLCYSCNESLDPTAYFSHGQRIFCEGCFCKSG